MTHNQSSKDEETLESVIMGLPNGCTIKTPNAMCTSYQAVHLEHSRRSTKATGSTPSEAVIRLAELLALKQLGDEDG